MPTHAENRRRTLLALGDAAMSLIEAHGPGVTIDAIARRAGVSRRTVFRHVRGKEELLFVHPLLWMEVFDAHFERTHDMAEDLRRAGAGIARHIDADPEPPRSAMSLALQHPQLLSGFNRVYREWVSHIATAICADPDQQAERFRAQVIAAATMGLVDATCREWLLEGPQARFEPLWERGFDILVSATQPRDPRPTQSQ